MAPQPELPSNNQSHQNQPYPHPHDTEVSMTSQVPTPPPTSTFPPASQPQNVPYPQPSSSSPYLTGQQQQQQQKSNTATSSMEASGAEDPVWMKCKSAVFRGAGAAQSKIGNVIGVNDLEHRGQEWEAWAARTSEQANTMTEQGAPSRLHGEYNKWMGYMGKVLGHVSGDPEMEARGSQRTNEANEEIEKSRHSGY